MHLPFVYSCLSQNFSTPFFLPQNINIRVILKDRYLDANRLSVFNHYSVKMS